MHLTECFGLALPRLAASDQGVTGHDYPADLSFLNSAPSALETEPQQIIQGSIAEALHCIVLQWGTKSQTNFYIPPESIAGYSYLFEDDSRRVMGQGPHHGRGSHSAHRAFHGHRQSHHPAFVHAEKPNNLHPHHYDVYTHGVDNSTKMPTMTITSMHLPINITSIAGAENLASVDTHGESSIGAAPMTIPFVHPDLQMPVPPLHLPWYFGALCWSFAVAGALGLYMPAKWSLYGGGFDEKKKLLKKHWYPWRSFKMTLTLIQAPCSFLADYVHMTNISVWHTIDRFLACFLMALELTKVLVMRKYTRPGVYMIYLVCISFGVFSFLKSQQAQQRLNADGFVFWHNGWHCYPLLAAVVHLLDHHLDKRWGEYYDFTGGSASCDHSPSNEGTNTAEITSDDTERNPMETTNRQRKSSTPASPGLRRSRRIAGQKPEISSI